MRGWTPARINWLVKDEDLVWGLLEAVQSSAGVPRTDRWILKSLDHLIGAALDAVGQDIEVHPRRDLLLALIRDETDLSDEEVAICLELIYSHMVNRFKGDLMEILACRPLGDLLHQLQQEQRVPRAAKWIWGSGIHELQENGRIWAKGADALLVCSGKEHNSWDRAAECPVRPAMNALVVYGAAEIKSYGIGSRTASIQLARHWRRLKHGLRIEGKQWKASRILVCGIAPKSFQVLPVSCSDSLELLNFLITPIGMHRNPELESSKILRATVPFPRVRIMSAAYCMTEWFCGRLGARVFEEKNDGAGSSAAEEAGFNRIKEALYHIQLRDYQGLKEFSEDQTRWRSRAKRIDRIASRLYNAYGWGLAAAVQHREMMWSTDAEAPG